MTAYEKIYEIVKKIPRGKVATYGQIARLAGNEKWSRVVGYALHVNPSESEIPCFRVVNRFGGLAPAFAFGGIDVQAERLRQEGIEVRPDNTVDLNKFLWNGL